MSKKRAALSRNLAISLLAAGVVGATVTNPPAVYAATLGSLSGTITSAETGQPLEGAEVALLAPDGSVQQRAKSDAKGNFFFAGLPPGNYTVRASVVTFKLLTLPVTVTQDQTANITLSLTKTIVSGQSTVRVPPIPSQRVTQTATAQVVTALGEQHLKSQAYDLYQYPGLLIGQPGFTQDPATGLVDIRGSDTNQVGYQLDGVDITNPRNNYFATNLVTNGIKSANVYTAGADASYAGHTGGFVNVITNNGRDIRGGVIEYTGPGSSNWNYQGTNTQYGNVIAGTKLDYYASTVLFKNDFPNDVFGLQKVNSYDGLFKVNYYADNNNTVTLEHTNGYERYETPGTHTAKFNESTNTFDPVPETNDLSNQTYYLDIFNYKHNYSNTAYGNIRYYYLRSGYEVYNGPGDGGYYAADDTTKQSVSYDYVNQFSRTDQLKFGYAFEPDGVGYRQTGPALGRDQNIRIHTYQNRAYLTNQTKLAGSKLVLDTGAVYASQKYDLVTRQTSTGSVDPSYTASYVDPRVGLAYALNPTTVIRSNYGITSQFADAQRDQIAVGRDALGLGFNPDQPTTDASLITRYGVGNQLRPEHSVNVDFGVEKGFLQNGGLLDGSYDVLLNTYKRNQGNQILMERTTYVPVGGTRLYASDGKAVASGVEFLLTKRTRRPSDWNGFLSYTNQVTKNTASLGNAYDSFFYSAFAGTSFATQIGNAAFSAANQAEYPAAYAQRHTVYLDATKRFSKVFETSFNLDAGSGYPFLNGIAIETGAYGIDAQHAPEGFQVGNAGFTEVPILLPGGAKIQPLSPVSGYSGWHYKISLNTNFYLSDRTNLFFNVDNIFDRMTTLFYAPYDAQFNDFYEKPSAAYPQGRVIYGPNITNTPVQVTFGVRTKF